MAREGKTWNRCIAFGVWIILKTFLEALWGIHGRFTGYSWHIHMYRVCVGNVSGMYRESVEGDWARGGEVCQPRTSTDGHGNTDT